jgi:protein TonB
MDVTTLENLVRWNLQLVILVAAAAVVVSLLRVSAPAIRHTFWRVVLATCLLLPLLQPWRAMTDPISQAIDIVVPAPSPEFDIDGAGGRAPALVRAANHLRVNWLSYVTAILAAGVVIRLVWLVMGIVRLQRLRRTGQFASVGDGYHEVSALIEAGAEIRRVDRLGQPVTFGIVKPAVLLPASFCEMPEGVQRAVLAHELWHVRRHDWAWVLFEEVIRAAFWFNPIMGWLLSRVQSSREEVVDELTVQLTNSRKTYLEALLVFADQPTLFPAAPFARRRHLFHRMLLISREAVMSSRRIIASSVSMAGVLLVAGFYATSALPLKAAPVVSGSLVHAQSPQSPPRDRRPAETGPETGRERELKAAIAANTAAPPQYFELARLQEARGAMSEAEATLVAATKLPGLQYAQTMLASFYNRTGRFDQAVATLEGMAAATPSTPQVYQIIATFYWEKASKDPSLNDAQKRAYIDSGIDAADRALAVQDNYVDAIVYKNILLRQKAMMETDAASRQALLAQADALRNRAVELQKQRGEPTMAFAPAMDRGTLPPPPPPPPPPGMDGVAPLRVGGNIKPPMKIRDVKPIYPQAALDAKIQGVVIIEATIDTSGFIAEARVLRGVPLLDEAALDAVRQWQFAPTQLNGVAVPVTMTLTVNFTLQ